MKLGNTVQIDSKIDKMGNLFNSSREIKGFEPMPQTKDKDQHFTTFNSKVTKCHEPWVRNGVTLEVICIILY